MRSAGAAIVLAAGLLAAHHVEYRNAEAAVPVVQEADTIRFDGLWIAKRRFGPDVGGLLVLVNMAGSLTAEIAGYAVPVRRAGNEISFALPDSVGAFRGKIAAGGERIRGHWYQPPTVANGTAYLSPVDLLLDERGRWVGEVVPLADELTMFLRVGRGPADEQTVFLRNPERNLGRQLRASRIERRGEEVLLLGRRNGAGAEIVLARGPIRANGFTLYFAGRGGSYDFTLVDEDAFTPFYPRGRPVGDYTYSPPLALDDGWPVGTLAEAGLSTDSIAAFVRYLISQSMDSLSAQQVHALLIARRGKLVLEEYFHGEHRDKPHDTRSAGKSVASTLVGAAIQASRNLTLESPVYAVMNGGRFPADLQPGKEKVTLRHFLNMASGIDCDDSDPDSPGSEERLLDQEEEPDYYRFILNLPLIRAPGTRAVYCSVQPHLIGGVVKVASGQRLEDIFDELLAQPLGLGRYYLNLSPTGDPYMGGGVRLTARDFAKFGQLYLDGGTWRGRRILSEEYVREASTPRFDLAGIRYGFQWWVIDYPYRGRSVQAYFAGGNGGQLVMVIPALETVVTTFAANYSDPVLHKLQRRDVPTYIFPAVLDGE